MYTDILTGNPEGAMLDEGKIRSIAGCRPFRWYARIGSTNGEALDWLRQGAPAGAFVVADEQLRGRGRQGRSWHTPAGSALAVSLVVRPAPDELPQLTMAGALAIADVAAAAGARQVSLKWPNDVLVGRRKLAGVLSEALWQGAELSGAVLGMGINVRVDFAGSELQGVATSLEAECGRRLDRGHLLKMLLDRVGHWLGPRGRGGLFHAWRDALALPQEQIVIGGRAGLPAGVRPDGSLLLRDGDGRLHAIYSSGESGSQPGPDGR